MTSETIPTFVEGESSSPQLVVPSSTGPYDLLWDVALPLIAAIALPLLLKRALESQAFLRLFRFPPAKSHSSEAESTGDFDFDGD